MTKERQEDYTCQCNWFSRNFDQLLRNNSIRRLMARYPALHQFVRYLLEKNGQKKALLLDTEGAAVQDIWFTQVKGDDTKNYSPLYSQVERFIELRKLLSHPPPPHIKKWTHLETLQQANATIKNLQKVQDKRAANFSSVQIKVPTVIFRATERDRASPFQANPSGPPDDIAPKLDSMGFGPTSMARVREHLAALEGTPTSLQDEGQQPYQQEGEDHRYHKKQTSLNQNGMKKNDNCMLAASADQLKRLGKVKGSLTAKHVGEMTVAYLRDNRVLSRPGGVCHWRLGGLPKKDGRKWRVGTQCLSSTNIKMAGNDPPPLHGYIKSDSPIKKGHSYIIKLRVKTYNGRKYLSTTPETTYEQIPDLPIPDEPTPEVDREQVTGTYPGDKPHGNSHDPDSADVRCRGETMEKIGAAARDVIPSIAFRRLKEELPLAVQPTNVKQVNNKRYREAKKRRGGMPVSGNNYGRDPNAPAFVKALNRIINARCRRVRCDVGKGTREAPAARDIGKKLLSGPVKTLVSENVTDGDSSCTTGLQEVMMEEAGQKVTALQDTVHLGKSIRGRVTRGAWSKGMFPGKNQKTNRVRDRFGNDLSKRLNVKHMYTIGRRKGTPCRDVESDNTPGVLPSKFTKSDGQKLEHSDTARLAEMPVSTFVCVGWVHLLDSVYEELGGTEVIRTRLGQIQEIDPPRATHIADWRGLREQFCQLEYRRKTTSV
ncbi:hypothetical protein Bbelb_049710 [Branchiostoma belcheri]|nr:hypothetical protein Bbelb_049710 [Branchiostoma belcheri]